MTLMDRRVVALIAVLAAAACATTHTSVTLPVGRGDTIKRMLSRHIDEVRTVLQARPELAGLSDDELIRKLLTSNSGVLLLPVETGNWLLIDADGRLSLVRGHGPALASHVSPSVAKKVMEDLAEGASETVHEELLASLSHSGVRMSTYAMSADHREVTVGGRTLRAGPGIELVPRTEHFHVVGDAGGTPFNIPVWPVDGVPFAIPSNPYFYESADGEIVAKQSVDATMARMIRAGELHPHEGHYHITRALKFGPWQQLDGLATGGGEDPQRQKLAGQIEAQFLGERMLIDPSTFALDLAAIETRIRRAWDSLEADMSGPELTFIVEHDAYLDMGGKLLYVGRDELSAGDGLRFALCRHHVHILGDESALGINVAVEPPVGSAKLVVPENVFVEEHGGRVTMKKLSPKVIALLREGAVAAQDHVYHVTESFVPESMAALKAAAASTGSSPKLQAYASSVLTDVLERDIPISTEAALFGALRRAANDLNDARATIERCRVRAGRGCPNR